MKKFNYGSLCLILLILSGILWGLAGAFQFDLVGYIFGSSVVSRIIYALFGVAGLSSAFLWIKRANK